MLGLTIIVATADPARCHAALSLAAAQAALGARARVYLHAEAVGLLAQEEHGDPGLAQLTVEAIALGVSFMVCQSGLDLAGVHFSRLPPGTEAGGMVSLLTSLDGDRLVAF